jgi:hypothetical protein
MVSIDRVRIAPLGLLALMIATADLRRPAAVPS